MRLVHKWMRTLYSRQLNIVAYHRRFTSLSLLPPMAAGLFHTMLLCVFWRLGSMCCHACLVHSSLSLFECNTRRVSCPLLVAKCHQVWLRFILLFIDDLLFLQSCSLGLGLTLTLTLSTCAYFCSARRFCLNRWNRLNLVAYCIFHSLSLRCVVVLLSVRCFCDLSPCQLYFQQCGCEIM